MVLVTKVQGSGKRRTVRNEEGGRIGQKERLVSL